MSTPSSVQSLEGQNHLNKLTVKGHVMVFFYNVTLNHTHTAGFYRIELRSSIDSERDNVIHTSE